MIDPIHHKRGHRVVCIDNKLESGAGKDDFLVVGGLYQISGFVSKQIFIEYRMVPHPHHPERILRRPIYETWLLVRLRLMPGVFFNPAWFAPASEYQTVITFYQDLILNPPENKGHPTC